MTRHNGEEEVDEDDGKDEIDQKKKEKNSLPEDSDAKDKKSRHSGRHRPGTRLNMGSMAMVAVTDFFRGMGPG